MIFLFWLSPTFLSVNFPSYIGTIFNIFFFHLHDDTILHFRRMVRHQRSLLLSSLLLIYPLSKCSSFMNNIAMNSECVEGTNFNVWMNVYRTFKMFQKKQYGEKGELFHGWDCTPVVACTEINYFLALKETNILFLVR